MRANGVVIGILNEVGFRRQGYLFVVGPKGASQLEANYRLQAEEGVRVELLDRAALSDRFPSIGNDDVALACYSSDDGWFDPAAALQGFRRKAKRLGVTYVDSRVTALEADKQGVQAAHSALGERIRAAIFVNAAGAWAGEVAEMAGMQLPVHPYCRLQHYWLCRAEIEALPPVKDAAGPPVHHQEGGGVIGGIGEGYFERVVWPLLVQRVPQFDALRCERTWAGHYAQNVLDGNMILGPWVGGANNFYVACGFSGHGTMHAPAVGLALTELILNGRYSTLDLRLMSFQRVLDGQPYAEKGIT